MLATAAPVNMKALSVHNAASRGDIDILMQLIKDPEAFNATTSTGWSLLHTAAQHDHEKCSPLPSSVRTRKTDTRDSEGRRRERGVIFFVDATPISLLAISLFDAFTILIPNLAANVAAAHRGRINEGQESWCKLLEVARRLGFMHPPSHACRWQRQRCAV